MIVFMIVCYVIVYVWATNRTGGWVHGSGSGSSYPAFQILLSQLRLETHSKSFYNVIFKISDMISSLVLQY